MSHVMFLRSSTEQASESSSKEQAFESCYILTNICREVYEPCYVLTYI